MARVLSGSRSYAELLLALEPDTLRPISRAEYDRMVALGLFEDEGVELLHGVLVAVSPQGPAHNEVIDRLNETLVPALLGRARVRIQGSFAASDDSQPEPDVAVFPRENYGTAHPTQALLVVEVSESSLEKDRSIKQELYAAVGVPEYWIVNLEDRVVEVYTQPENGIYTVTGTKGPEDTLSPLAFSDIRIRVGTLFP
jgi:Uma2 family endonuclease